MRMHRITAGIVGITLALGLTVARAADTTRDTPSRNDRPDAKLSLSGTAAAIGIGTEWGSGTLTYNGKHYPVRLRGLAVGDVGGSKIEINGDVYHLKNLADFDGTYAAVGAAGAVPTVGAGHSLMRNEHGVVIDVASDRQGLEVKAGVDGVKLSLAGSEKSSSGTSK